MNKPLKTEIYTSNHRLKSSFIEVYNFYIHSLLKYKKFMWANFLKNFKASYEQSFLRFFWKLTLPLVPVGVYVILQMIGVLKGSTNMPKVLYVVIGMTFWQLFTSSLQAVISSPIKDSAMLKKMNLPFILFYISNLGEVIFDFLIRIGLVVILFFILGVDFNFWWLALPFMSIPFIVSALALGIFISFFSVFFGDIKNIVDIVVRYGLFASGVIFPLPASLSFSFYLKLNPLYIYIENLRSLVVFGSISDFGPFWIANSVVFIFCLFVLKKLYSIEARLREYL